MTGNVSLQEVDGDKAVAQEFEDLSKVCSFGNLAADDDVCISRVCSKIYSFLQDDDHVLHQESDNADAEGLSSSASHKSSSASHN